MGARSPVQGNVMFTVARLDLLEPREPASEIERIVLSMN
jgi:hypothetical protein